jgi:tetratricopeptide (TPR) repeat protein
MIDPLRTLAERMVETRTIGFVGAGTSARLGYPTWYQLINSLYEHASTFADVPPPDRDADMRWLAEVYGAEIRRRGFLQQVMRDILSDTTERETTERDEALRLHLLIARLPFTHFITTNYDDLLEEACNRLFEIASGRKPSDTQRCLTRDGRLSAPFSDFLRSFSQESQRSVLHLHGTLTGEQLTLALGDYDEQYLHEAMLLRMFSILATNTVVFIGASLRDTDIMELVRRSTFHTGGSQRHYAFLPDTRRAEAGMLRTSYGIEPIFYSPDNHHEELERRLEQLLELVEQRRPGSPEIAGGNAGPVDISYGDSFEDAVALVKDEIRRVRSGPARIDGLGPVGTSRVLRRVTSDYRALPVSYRFRHVIWLSPGRVGLFPSRVRSRRIVDTIIGEIVYSLGRHRLTGTSNPTNSIRSIKQILGGVRWGASEPALFIVDDVEALRGEAEDGEAFDSLLSALPRESIAVYQRPPSAEQGPRKGSLVDPFVEAEMFRKEPWAKAEYEHGLTTLLDRDGGDSARRVLAALCVVSTPTAAAVLSVMLQMSVAEVGDGLRTLRELSCVEGVLGVDGDEPPSVDERTRSVGILSPVRWSVLTDQRFHPVLTEVVTDLLRWAEATVEGFARWEDDNAQLEELIRQLPNVLTIFEASCWQHRTFDDAFDQSSIDRYLWLGTDLAYILYNVGRWSEAEQLLEYLDELSIIDPTDDGTVCAAGVRTVSELQTFRREVLILQSRYLSRTGHTHRAFNKAIAMAEAAISNADDCLQQDEPAHEPSHNTYAPNRLTLARQRARAQVARAVARTRIGDLGAAEVELSGLLETRSFDDGDRHRAQQRESLLIVSDASRALGAVRWEQLEKGEDLPAKVVLGELDEGRSALVMLDNRRERGHHAQRRGDVLFKLGNVIAARRYYARAFLISLEFKDRYLEAGAMLGLARCDGRSALADRSRGIFEDLNLPERAGEAGDVAMALSQSDEITDVPSRHPMAVVVVGLPGSGKAIVTRTAGSALAEWGYEPSMRRDLHLIGRIRSGEEPDLATVAAELLEPMVADAEAAEVPRVGVAKVATGRFCELVEPWAEDERLIGHILCIRMDVAPELLRDRNAQRRRGQVEVDVLEHMIEETRSNEATALGWSSWEAFFQAHGGALVTVDSAGSIIDLENRVRDALALSFLPFEALVDVGDWEGSTA